MMKYVAAGLGITVLLLGAALSLSGKAYLAQRDENVKLVHTAQIARLTQEHKEAMETAVKAVTVAYDTKIAEAEISHKDEVNDIMLQLASAQQDAAQKPVAFGDRLIRDIIRVDCLWASGIEGTSGEGRQACRDEAALADPTKSGLPFTILTPDFLINWADACEDWRNVRSVVDRGPEDDLVYTKANWEKEYGTFDAELCRETLVAMTPEASLLFRAFISNGESYSAKLVTHAVEQSRIIDILSQ